MCRASIYIVIKMFFLFYFQVRPMVNAVAAGSCDMMHVSVNNLIQTGMNKFTCKINTLINAES